jgi:hypothetical protein
MQYVRYNITVTGGSFHSSNKKDGNVLVMTQQVAMSHEITTDTVAWQVVLMTIRKYSCSYS